MSALITNIDWQRNTKDFTYDSFNRSHIVYFSGDQEITNSAAPEYKGDGDAANPEELLGAAVGSCHMLTFLAIASKQGYVVENYECKNEAIMGKNEQGKTVVTDIHLHPITVFSGEKQPTKEQLKTMHDTAHANCFIAQSIKTKVSVHLP